MILLFNLLSIWMVYISFHFHFVKRNIFAVPIAVVNDWSPIVLVLGNYKLLTPLQLPCKVPLICKAAVHTTHMHATQIIILYIFKNVFNCLHCGKICSNV